MLIRGGPRRFPVQMPLATFFHKPDLFREFAVVTSDVLGHPYLDAWPNMSGKHFVHVTHDTD